MYKRAHKNLLKWYEKNGRHELPWRQTTDPYKIYISEIMLQQTQVKTVLERFYFPFLEAFATLQDLAQAREDDVLKKWEGLGYYTRARNLHKAAKICHKELPKTVKELVSLPGIGQSTAHAVVAFSYKTPVPILDANVKRILYRVFGVKKASEKELWALAYKLFDTQHPYEYNQAMMDLGSIICQSKSVQCEPCPFNWVCQAKDDNPLLYPVKKVKKVIPIRSKNIFIYTHNNTLALQQRQTHFLNGLWGFVEEEKHEIKAMQLLGSIVQKYSHFHLHADVYQFENPEYESQWFALEHIKELALSGADHKALALFIQNNKVSNTVV